MAHLTQIAICLIAGEEKNRKFYVNFLESLNNESIRLLTLTAPVTSTFQINESPRGIFASVEVLQNGGTERTSTYQKYVHRMYTEPNLQNIYIQIQNKNKPGCYVEHCC